MIHTPKEDEGDEEDIDGIRGGLSANGLLHCLYWSFDGFFYESGRRERQKSHSKALKLQSLQDVIKVLFQSQATRRRSRPFLFTVTRRKKARSVLFLLWTSCVSCRERELSSCLTFQRLLIAPPSFFIAAPLPVSHLLKGPFHVLDQQEGGSLIGSIYVASTRYFRRVLHEWHVLQVVWLPLLSIGKRVAFPLRRFKSINWLLLEGAFWVSNVTRGFLAPRGCRS